jgi:hypothetical protein
LKTTTKDGSARFGERELFFFLDVIRVSRKVELS